MKLNSPFVITISRQLGSGGAYIGQQLAKKLNIFYADREIISEAARQFSVVEEELANYEEKVSSFWKSYVESSAWGTPDVYIPPQVIPNDRDLFNVEKNIIEQIAKERSAVIIGRCGAHILQDHPNHFSLFLYSDYAARVERVQKLYAINAAAAEKMINKSDKERAQYNQLFTKKDWRDAWQYDLSINTGKIGVDKSVELILKCLE